MSILTILSTTIDAPPTGQNLCAEVLGIFRVWWKLCFWRGVPKLYIGTAKTMTVKAPRGFARDSGLAEDRNLHAFSNLSSNKLGLALLLSSSIILWSGIGVFVYEVFW